jgi:hypothetical protein
MRFEPTWERYLAYKRPRISDGAPSRTRRPQPHPPVLRSPAAPGRRRDGRREVDAAFRRRCRRREDRSQDGQQLARAPVGVLCVVPLASRRPRRQQPVRVRRAAAGERGGDDLPHAAADPRLPRVLLARLPATGVASRANRRTCLGSRGGTCRRPRLDNHVVRIYRQRDRKRGSVGTKPTKSTGKFRSVSVGPELVQALRDLLALRAEHGIVDDGWLFLCPRRVAGATPTAPCPCRLTARPSTTGTRRRWPSSTSV